MAKLFSSFYDADEYANMLFFKGKAKNPTIVKTKSGLWRVFKNKK